MDVLLWRQAEHCNVSRVRQGGLPFWKKEDYVHCPLKGPWQMVGQRALVQGRSRGDARWEVVFAQWNSPTSIRLYQWNSWIFEKKVASSKESRNSSMRRIRLEPQTITMLGGVQYTKSRAITLLRAKDRRVQLILFWVVQWPFCQTSARLDSPLCSLLRD